MNKVDVIIIGAGAAGLMCGIEAGARGRQVVILEKSNKAGKKILMSGGGRCNFTNIHTTPEQYSSQNPHFCKSALNRYTQWSFINMVERHKIKYYEKTLGQLFCEHKSSQIVDMLLTECQKQQVTIKLNQNILSVQKTNDSFMVTAHSVPTSRGLTAGSSDVSRSVDPSVKPREVGYEEKPEQLPFMVKTNDLVYQSESLVIASGGLSIPTLGSSPFGYQIAAQFGLVVHPTRAGLVPLTWHPQDKLQFEGLSGISVDSLVRCNGQSFRENLLFTHRGLSGPAILQISSYWRPGDEVVIQLLPEIDLHRELLQARDDAGESALKTILANYLAKRVLSAFIEPATLDKPLKQFNTNQLLTIADAFQQWVVKPNGTEGYRTAEVTLGGVDCDELSSQRFEAKKVSGLFFIGEVLDVSGWLGGYNFQWAWASGWAAGQVV